MPDGRPPEVEVRRSTRRRRTVSAYRDGDRIVVLVPARLSRAEEARWVQKMVGNITQRESRSRGGAAAGDPELAARAEQLGHRYLAGRVRPVSVRWVSNMRRRWASCTPIAGTIRLSDRLRTMPDWVIDYVLMHELAHLLEPGHGPEFWALVAAYPRTERARGYLDGVSAAAGFGIEPDNDVDE